MPESKTEWNGPPRNLEELLGGQPSIADFLRNQPTGPNAYPGVPAEYSNWRDEQRAWAETCVLFNQSFHMADLAVEGPDALTLLSQLGINSMKGFRVDKAKQFVPVTPDGHVIGDVILFYLAENRFNLVGRAPTLNWVRYHAETGGYDVRTVLDQRTALRSDGKRKGYRFQVQGPYAMNLIAQAIGHAPPDLKFFNMTLLRIAGCEVRALRHGMAGQPGWELFGPWEQGEAVRQALIVAGRDHGMRLCGGRTYPSNTLESGWIPSPLPAIYTSDELRSYREWLPADSYEGTCSIGGSFISDDIRDYYLTPWDLGYGSFAKFDHDFIGREALQRMAAAARRKKVTLAVESEDVLRVVSSAFTRTERAKYIEFPSAVYAMHQFDKVLTQNGELAGLSTWIGYSANEGRMLSLATLDEAHAEIGTSVTLVWGEENGGTGKLTVERHVQAEMRAVVSPVPYSEVARDSYAEGWRTQPSRSIAGKRVSERGA